MNKIKQKINEMESFILKGFLKDYEIGKKKEEELYT